MADRTEKAAVIEYTSPLAGYCRIMAVTATAGLIVFFPLPFIASVMFGSHPVITVLLVTIAVLSLLFFALAINAYRSNRAGRLIITDTGIMWGRSARKGGLPWSKVKTITFLKKPLGGATDGEFVIKRESGSPLSLQTSSLSQENLDKLVSACSLWANAWSKDESFTQLLESVTRKRSDTSDSNFTALWMQESQRRLNTTPFVPLAPGKSLQNGRVKVVQPLTAGGWSAIYLCQWTENTPAILKEAVVPPLVAAPVKEKAYEHFEREAVLLSGLEHKQIAKVLDYFIEDGRQYMVLERLTGANLRTFIKDKGAVSHKQASKWIGELVDILSYLHSRQPAIIHRDLTPENLVLDMKGSLVLIDFGSANEFVATCTGTLVGKPSYIAPEQFSGHSTLQSDLYSLGAVIYFMYTGQDPEPLTVASPRLANAAVPEEVDSLVADLMKLDLKQRLKNIDAVKQRLSAAAVET
ncbi:MAG: serine/threonine-protein kinase [Candidatus Obscuribacterales bacterium]